jgi:acyl-CoA synthetase (AMP-forming)/AMP-acid ligase II/enoyl-CoA hydratase/carnithine racemase
MTRPLVTTRPLLDVRTIDDIRAIESRPYEDAVPARNLYDLFLATADQVGDAKALTVLRTPDPSDIGVALTHRELLHHVTRAANMFRALGIGPDRGVAAFLSPTVPEFPALFFGAQVAGVAATLNYLLSRDAIFDLLNAQQTTVLVVPSEELDQACWSKAKDVFDHVPTLEHVIVIGAQGQQQLQKPAQEQGGYLALEEIWPTHREDRLGFEPGSERDTVCALFHTGGTTGKPKLVRLTHGNQIHAAFGFAQVFGYDENDVVMNGFPFFHVGGTMTVGLSVIAAGGHNVIPSPYGMRPPEVVKNYWKVAKAFDATIVNGVPTTIGAILESWEKPDAPDTIRMAITGGAVMPAFVAARFMEKTAIPVFETYGMTETSAAIAFNPGRGTPVAGSAGLRAPYAKTRIIKDAQGPVQICKTGESGLVQVKGPQVFAGYLDAAQNAGVLDQDGWLTTGDIGYLRADERLVLTGRAKDLIVRSGHNIDPAAIEDVANRFDSVRLSAAVGMPDQYAGEVAALFVCPHQGQSIDIENLKTHLERNIHERPALPKSVLVIADLPVTAVGKIFKPKLRELAIEEKIRLEVAATCGPKASAQVTFRSHVDGSMIVDVVLWGATLEGLHLLNAALAPLPQSYHVALQPEIPAEAAVLLSAEAGIARLTLNRPLALNAMSQEMIDALESALDQLDEHADLRALIITGAGRGFCAGGDLIEFEQALNRGKDSLLGMLARNQDIIQRIEDLPMPVIAAVNGAAVAGGLELLLCCDIIIAAQGAKIGDGHARYAIIPAAGASVRLHERLSPSHAAQLLYTAALVDAETLRDWGLVNEVVPKDQLLHRAETIARDIAKCSPEVVRRVKRLVAPAAQGTARKDRMAAEITAFSRHIDDRNLTQGLQAFREKKTPKYT